MTEQQILTLTLIGEAVGEPVESIVGVGCVIRNRVNKSKIKESYHDICLAPKQFSCWNEGTDARQRLIDISDKLLNGKELEIINDPYIKQCFFLAEGIIDSYLVDNTKNAIYYLEQNIFNDTSKRPHWASFPKNIIQHGHHIFFSL